MTRFRYRTMDPGFWAARELKGVSVPAKFLLLGLISHADDRGRVTGDPEALRLLVYPFKCSGRPSETRLCALLDELEDASVIRCYSAQTAEKDYGPAVALMGWQNGASWMYQSITRPSEPRFPGPPGGQGRVQARCPSKKKDQQPAKPAKPRVLRRTQ